MTKLVLARARSVRQDASGDDVPSPCVSVCRMDVNTGWCDGCLRTLDEIAAWGRMPDEGKRRIWAEIEARAGVKA